MAAKFISTVLKAASVATVPLVMLAASVPASAQRPGQRSHSERRGNVDQEVLAQLQRAQSAVIGMDPRESIGYGNSGVYQGGRYNNGHRKNPHYKNGHYKNKHYRNGRYRNGRDDNGYDNERDDNERDDNGRYNDGRYGNGQYGQYPAPVIVQRPVYGNRGVAGKSLPAPQRGNGYPSQVISRFPTRNVPSGRAGKALPRTGQQTQNNGARHRGY